MTQDAPYSPELSTAALVCGPVAYGAYKAYVNEDGGPAWVELGDRAREAFSRLAHAVIVAYDDYLTGKADLYGAQVAAAPSFNVLVEEAQTADDEAKLEAARAAVNPADQFAQAQAIEAAQAAEQPTGAPSLE